VHVLGWWDLALCFLMFEKGAPHANASLPQVWAGLDEAHTQTALGTAPQPSRDLSLSVSVLRASLSGEATGGAVCPALNSRLLLETAPS